MERLKFNKVLTESQFFWHNSNYRVVKFQLVVKIRKNEKKKKYQSNMNSNSVR